MITNKAKEAGRRLKSVLTVLITAGLLGVIAFPAAADWGHPVKWDSLSPGFDIVGAASWIDSDTPSDAFTADDFQCVKAGYITAVRFAGSSAMGDDYIDAFRVTIWSDVPATANDASHPGQLLYDKRFYRAADSDPLNQGWRDLGDGTYLINIPQTDWFLQSGSIDQPVVYWIGIQGVMINDGYGDAFYWQFKERHAPAWNGAAAFTSNFYSYAVYSNWGSPSGYADADSFGGLLPGGWTALDMAFQLNGVDATSVSTHLDKLADVRALGQGVLVSITGVKVATVASGTFSDGSIYVEEPDRSTGLKALGCSGIGLWDNLTLTGFTALDSGEKSLQTISVDSKAPGSEIGSLGMLNKSLTSSGLLTTIWGRVIAKSGSSITIDDGSDSLARARMDGLLTPITKTVNVGDYISVTGPAGLMAGGLPCVRPRSDADIQIY